MSCFFLLFLLDIIIYQLDKQKKQTCRLNLFFFLETITLFFVRAQGRSSTTTSWRTYPTNPKNCWDVGLWGCQVPTCFFSGPSGGSWTEGLLFPGGVPGEISQKHRLRSGWPVRGYVRYSGGQAILFTEEVPFPTTWDGVWNPVNNGIFTIPPGCQDFFHQEYFHNSHNFF